MLRIIASKHDVLRMLEPKQRPPHEEVWHSWIVIIPRRSITGRLLWGTVLRRRNEGRWIYKKNMESDLSLVRALIRDCRQTASLRRSSLGGEHEGRR